MEISGDSAAALQAAAERLSRDLGERVEPADLLSGLIAAHLGQYLETRRCNAASAAVLWLWRLAFGAREKTATSVSALVHGVTAAGADRERAPDGTLVQLGEALVRAGAGQCTPMSIARTLARIEAEADGAARFRMYSREAKSGKMWSVDSPKQRAR